MIQIRASAHACTHKHTHMFLYWLNLSSRERLMNKNTFFEKTACLDAKLTGKLMLLIFLQARKVTTRRTIKQPSLTFSTEDFIGLYKLSVIQINCIWLKTRHIADTSTALFFFTFLSIQTVDIQIHVDILQEANDWEKKMCLWNSMTPSPVVGPYEISRSRLKGDHHSCHWKELDPWNNR